MATREALRGGPSCHVRRGIRSSSKLIESLDMAQPPHSYDPSGRALFGCMFAPTEQEEVRMNVRVVRFTDVTADRLEGLLARIKESGGPPPGVPSTGLKLLFDEAQGTAVVLQYFATAEDMDAGAKVMGAMDASETPGTRASVDACELKLELEP
jgi:hypothetical protein